MSNEREQLLFKKKYKMDLLNRLPIVTHYTYQMLYYNL
jgi:hypothetical protein